ncbi:AraC family transcriptional regulator [Pelagibacterium lentulum]|uniref:Transcriptional regulator n=1 Tax=Pelagibacterium lentulum TaxID=2029865 RepID=A0A916RE45_9HYPH|nr:AraC family transcriptional regulator [Pelagibacterium lentulum]GGA54361.1 transcriptional regulator [Pelagibacterium lentulum]
MRNIQDLADCIAQHAREDGFHSTALPHVRLARSAAPTLPMPAAYTPSLCLIAQGEKEAQLGSHRLSYAPGQYLLAAVDLPVMGSVTKASRQAPYYCLILDLDRAAVADLVATDPAPGTDRPPPAFGLIVAPAHPELVDAACRLLALLDDEKDATALAPLIEREILWRLLRSPAGPILRHIAATDSHAARIERAISWLREHFAKTVSVDYLAALAGMSPSAFHEHFKAVTGLSPLRYRSQLRLQEARRLMLSEGLEAAHAGFEVGYNSPSQFSREYNQAFGLPPVRDITRLRTIGGLQSVA